MSLKTQSSSAYHMLRTSEFVIMPSVRTLNDYIHFYRARTGFHDDLDLELAARAKVKQFMTRYSCQKSYSARTASKNRSTCPNRLILKTGLFDLPWPNRL